MPAPVSCSRSVCSRTMTRKPLRASASAAVSPPMPAPTTMTMRDVTTSRSLDEFAAQGTFRGPGFLCGEARIVAVERGTIGADIFVIVAHVAEDMGMIERRQSADAHEFLGANLNDRDAKVVMEVRDDLIGHGDGFQPRTGEAWR